MSDNTLERIAKLLAQAENTDNDNEASVFMAKAQQLATLSSIDLARARALNGKRFGAAKLEQREIVLGVRGTRGLNTLVRLASGIADANEVKMDIAHNSTRVYCYGFSHDIDVVERLYASLVVQMATAAEAFRKGGTWKQDTHYVEGRYRHVDERTGKQCSADSYYAEQEWVDGGEKPVTWLQARLSFQLGFARTVGNRLADAKFKAEEAARAAEAAVVAEAPEEPSEAPQGPGTDLVLADKRQEVRDYYKGSSNARGSYRGYKGLSNRSGVSGAAGREAGKNARLGGQAEIGGSKGAIGR